MFELVDRTSVCEAAVAHAMEYKIKKLLNFMQAVQFRSVYL
jgi:hypothetical protein